MNTPIPTTTRVHIECDASAYLRERWELDVPADLEGDDLLAYVSDALHAGDAEFIDQDVDGEHDRTITRINDQEVQ